MKLDFLNHSALYLMIQGPSLRPKFSCSTVLAGASLRNPVPASPKLILQAHMVQIFLFIASNENPNSGPHVDAVSTLLPHSSPQQGVVKFDGKTDWIKNHDGHWLRISGVAVRKFPGRNEWNMHPKCRWHNSIDFNMSRVKGTEGESQWCAHSFALSSFWPVMTWIAVFHTDFKFLLNYES